MITDVHLHQVVQHVQITVRDNTPNGRVHHKHLQFIKQHTVFKIKLLIAIQGAVMNRRAAANKRRAAAALAKDAHRRSSTQACASCSRMQQYAGLQHNVAGAAAAAAAAGTPAAVASSAAGTAAAAVVSSVFAFKSGSTCYFVTPTTAMLPLQHAGHCCLEP
jgi:hypothetical protein